jgi:hypothetical protein
VRIELVSAVDRDVDLLNVFERGHRNSQARGKVVRCYRRRNSANFQSFADFFAEEFHRVSCGRTGSQTHNVAVLHKAQAGAPGSFFFLIVSHVESFERIL